MWPTCSPRGEYSSQLKFIVGGPRLSAMRLPSSSELADSHCIVPEDGGGTSKLKELPIEPGTMPSQSEEVTVPPSVPPPEPPPPELPPPPEPVPPSDPPAPSPPPSDTPPPEPAPLSALPPDPPSPLELPPDPAPPPCDTVPQATTRAAATSRTFDIGAPRIQ